MPTYIPYLFNIVRQLLEPLARIEEYYTMVQQQMGNNVSLDAKGDIFLLSQYPIYVSTSNVPVAFVGT